MNRLCAVVCCLALGPLAALGQTISWDRTMLAASREYDQGHYHEAEEQFLKAEKEAESFGPLDTRMATTLNNLARLYVEEAKDDEAEQLYRRSLGIWEQCKGQDHRLFYRSAGLFLQ